MPPELMSVEPPSIKRRSPRSFVQVNFDPDVEAFRAEFAAFVDDHLSSEAETLERPRSVSHAARSPRHAG